MGLWDKLETAGSVAFPVMALANRGLVDSAKKYGGKGWDWVTGGSSDSSISEEAKKQAAAAGQDVTNLVGQARTDYNNAIDPSAYSMPHYGDMRQEYMDMARNAQRRAPQMTYAGNPFRGQQQQLSGMLAQRAMGTGGPSAAELQMRAGLDQQTAQAHALAASARGMSPAMAMRQAMIQGQQAGLATNQQAGILRAQEQMGAQQTLGNVLAQGRQQDQTAQIANMDAQLRQAGLNDQQRMFALSQATGLDVNELGAHMALIRDRMAALNAQYTMGMQGIGMKYGMQQGALGVQQQQQQRDDTFLGAGLNAISKYVGMSGMTSPNNGGGGGNNNSPFVTNAPDNNDYVL